jgi:glycosyltransferase involved in cell wall biosynthesis
MQKQKLKFALFAYWHDRHWTQFAGATVKILDLANNLTALGHEVTLFVPNYKFYKDRVSFNLKEIAFLNLPFLRFLSFNLCLLLSLTHFFLKSRPDVVYVRRMQSIIPMIFARLFKVLFFFEVNDDPYRQIYHSGSNQAFHIRSRLSITMDEVNLNKCDKAFVVTAEIKDKLLSNIPGLNTNKLIVLNSGANTTLFQPLNKSECCLSIGIDHSINYIGYLGAIFEHSGLDVLIECAHEIISENSDAEFLIFGDGPQKNRLVDKVKNLGLDHKFRFFGQIDYDQIPVHLGAADICVAPYLDTVDTNSGTKIFDYLACGKPVVASILAHKENIFAGSKAVRFVKPGDPKMLANAIIELLNNKQRTTEMSQNGRSFIVANYSREEIANKISSFASRLLTHKVRA